jgi:hypothetical protein
LKRTTPTAVVIDAEGELEIVCGMLSELGVDHVYHQGSKADPPLADPRCLLISTAVQAIEMGWRRNKAPGAATWLACVRGRSKTQRTLLRQAGFDMLVPDNVHPAALFLLLRQACFQGENTQRVQRVVVGEPMTYGTKLRSYDSLLLDLSPRGCRMLCDRRWPKGRRLTVHLPLPRPAGRTLTLRGEVVRVGSGRGEGGKPDEFSVAVQFEPLRPREKENLKLILRERLAGPATVTDSLVEGDAPTLTSLSLPQLKRSASAAATRGDTDTGPKTARFEREVTAICGGATRTLLGRDLTQTGMRIDATARLKDGERVRLALHGSARDEPILIEAHTERGEVEVWVRFDYMDPSSERKLRGLIASLPKLHRLQDEVPTHTAVVAQLFGRRR